jgi:hypothetical protein
MDAHDESAHALAMGESLSRSQSPLRVSPAQKRPRPNGGSPNATVTGGDAWLGATPQPELPQRTAALIAALRRAHKYEDAIKLALEAGAIELANRIEREIAGRAVEQLDGEVERRVGRATLTDQVAGIKRRRSPTQDQAPPSGAASEGVRSMHARRRLIVMGSDEEEDEEEEEESQDSGDDDVERDIIVKRVFVREPVSPGNDTDASQALSAGDADVSGDLGRPGEEVWFSEHENADGDSTMPDGSTLLDESLSYDAADSDQQDDSDEDDDDDEDEDDMAEARADAHSESDDELDGESDVETDEVDVISDAFDSGDEDGIMRVSEDLLTQLNLPRAQAAQFMRAQAAHSLALSTQ